MVYHDDGFNIFETFDLWNSIRMIGYRLRESELRRDLRIDTSDDGNCELLCEARDRWVVCKTCLEANRVGTGTAVCCRS